MLFAIESFVRLFERLIATAPVHATQSRHAHNDNAEMEEDERRWAAYR